MPKSNNKISTANAATNTPMSPPTIATTDDANAATDKTMLAPAIATTDDAEKKFDVPKKLPMTNKENTKIGNHCTSKALMELLFEFISLNPKISRDERIKSMINIRNLYQRSHLREGVIATENTILTARDPYFAEEFKTLEEQLLNIKSDTFEEDLLNLQDKIFTNLAHHIRTLHALNGTFPTKSFSDTRGEEESKAKYIFREFIMKEFHNVDKIEKTKIAEIEETKIVEIAKALTSFFDINMKQVDLDIALESHKTICHHVLLYSGLIDKIDVEFFEKEYEQQLQKKLHPEPATRQSIQAFKAFTSEDRSRSQFQ